MSLGRIGNEIGIVRKIVVSALALGLGTLAFGVAVAPADSSNAALHVSGTCEVFDGNGNIQEVPFKGVENNNHGFVVCKGQVPNNTGHAVHWNQNHNPEGIIGLQYICFGVNNQESTEWFTNVSASGRSTTKINCGTTR